MSSNYNINWTDGSLKVPFSIAAGSINNSSSSLTLTGKGRAEWGEIVQENMLHLLENFASNGTPPANPTAGMMWYNVQTNQLLFRTFVGVWEVLWPIP